MADKMKDGGPAFPVHGGHHPDDDPRNQVLGGGMTLRDWFAGQAMAAFIRRAVSADDWGRLAPASYEAADAMLAAREADHG